MLILDFLFLFLFLFLFSLNFVFVGFFESISRLIQLFLLLFFPLLWKLSFFQIIDASLLLA